MVTIVGISYGEGPPVPIPNTEVKLTRAENTWLETARENRYLPTQKEANLWFASFLFYHDLRTTLFVRDRSSGALKSAVTYLKDKLTGNSKVQAEVAEAKLDNAINDVNLENENTAQTDGERYAVKVDIDGKPFVEIDKDILDGVPESEWSKTVMDTFRKRYPNGIEVPNDIVKITYNNMQEFMNSKDSQRLYDTPAYADKLRTANNADEIVNVASGWINEAPKHSRKDSIKSFARGNVRIRVNGTDYSANVLIGNRADGSMVIHDITEMTEIDKIQEKEQDFARHDSEELVRSGPVPYGDNISQPDPTVKEQFSLKDDSSVDERLAMMRDKYGTMPKGEKPYRTVVVPKKTAKNKHVAQTVRTILEAKVTPEVKVQPLKALIAEGEFSFDRYTDKAAIADAEAVIKDKGWNVALADWINDSKRGKTSKENVALGWLLYNNAANSQDAKTAINILDYVIANQRNAGQAVQATRILKKLK